jgi:TP901 family phage tail tape measure protein
MAVSTIFMQTFNAIKDGVTYIYELDNALNQIRIVTGQSQQEVQKLAMSYNALAKSMGVSTKEIVSTSVDLYRQGLTMSQVSERMQGIIKYAKISGIELSESNKIITATMNTLGISAQETIDVMAYMGKILPHNTVMYC